MTVIENHSLNDTTQITGKIQTVLVEALQVSPDLVTPELAFGDLPQWDSMGHMEVMMYLEQYFGIEINNDTIAELTSIPAIRQYILDGHNQAKETSNG